MSTSNSSPDKHKLMAKPLPIMSMSFKRPIHLDSKNELNTKRSKIDKGAESNKVAINTNIKPGSEKKKLSTMVRDDQSISADTTCSMAETKESAATSNSKIITEKTIKSYYAREDKALVQPVHLNTIQSTLPTLSGEKQSSPILQDRKKDADMPLLDVYESNNIISFDQEIQPESIEKKRSSSSQTPPLISEQQCQLIPTQERQISDDHLEDFFKKQYIREISVKHPEGTNDNSQNIDFQCKPAVLAVPKPSSTAEQQFKSNQYTELPYLAICGKSCQGFKPREIREERSTVTGDDEDPRHHAITNNASSSSHHLSNSMKLSSEICNFRRAKLLSSITNKPIVNNSLSTNQTRYLPTGSMERQTHLITQNQQEVPGTHNRRIIEENSSNKQIFLHRSTASSSRTILNTQIRKSGEENRTDHKTCNQGIINIMSAAQIVSDQTHHPHCCIQQPDEQQYLPTKENNFQQIPLRETVKTSTQNQGIDQSGFYDAFMKKMCGMQNKPNHVNQTSCSVARNENQHIQIDQYYLQNERLNEEQPRRSSEIHYTDHRPHPRNVRINVPSTVQNYLKVTNQFDYNPKYLQQTRSNHQEIQQNPCMPKIRDGVSIQTKNNSYQPKPQGVIRTPLLPVTPKVSNIMRPSFLTTNRNYSIRDPRIQARLKEKYTEQNDIARATHPQSINVEPTPVRQKFEVQPTSSSKRLHETQYKQVHDNQVYENPHTIKMVVNQSPETNAATKQVHFEDYIMRSPPTESSLIVMNSMGRTDECFSGELLSPDQALISDYVMTTEETPVEMKRSIPTEDDPSVRPIIDQPTTSTNQVNPRVVIEQEMLDQFAVLFTQMGTTLSQTSDMFKSLRSSILDSAKIYHRMIEAVNAFNTFGDSLNTSTSSYVLSKTSHSSCITEKRQTREENPNNTYNSVSKTPKPKQNHHRTFVMPLEYDSNNSKWTLKYRGSMPGLVELLPQSEIYVSYSQLEHCKWASRDCNTLARMLLTEVFSISALSVCTLTGRKAKASGDVDNVRPGLDKWARTVLLKFVRKFGLQCGWNTSDTQSISHSMRNKINEIRAKYGTNT